MLVSDEANELLSRVPFALLIGMVLDQQVPLEKAFSSPLELQARLGGSLTVEGIAEADPDELASLFAKPPALHRFPGANAKRVQALAQLLMQEYDGDAAAVWTTARSGDELVKRVRKLPGFGEQKAKIFVALLGKQMGVDPRGWRKAAEPYSKKGTTMSVADITDRESLLAVRAWKQAKKAAARAENPSG